MERTDPPDLLTMEGIAERKGVHLNTVRRWRVEGVLPGPDLEFGPRRLFWYEETISHWESPAERVRAAS